MAVNSSKKRQLLILLTLLFIVVREGHAQDQEKISSDRPDRSQGTSTVPRYTLQLEAGFDYQKDALKEDETKMRSFPSLMLRYGLLDKLELRVESSLQDSVVKGSDPRLIRGFGPLVIGGRIRLWEQKAAVPEAALTSMMTLPIGSAGLHPRNPEARVNLGLSNNLSRVFSLTNSFSYGWVQDAVEVQFASNLLVELNDRLSLYGEYFGLKEQEHRAEHTVDTGVLWFPWQNLQLDIAAGTGLNKAAPDYFFTTGISVRLPR